MPYAEPGGVRIYHRMSGAPPPPVVPLLLSHGFGETSKMWQPNVPALARDRRVITWDMRGHGRSDACPRAGRGEPGNRFQAADYVSAKIQGAVR